jgi:hypothetical protein
MTKFCPQKNFFDNNYIICKNVWILFNVFQWSYEENIKYQNIISFDMESSNELINQQIVVEATHIPYA